MPSVTLSNIRRIGPCRTCGSTTHLSLHTERRTESACVDHLDAIRQEMSK